MTTLWSIRVAKANPQRLVTFTRIGDTRDDIRKGLQFMLREIRRAGYAFEYWGVIELHKNLKPHMHVVQKGRFLPQPLLSAICIQLGWGFSDIRAVTQGWSATRYCAKHLCHSHGRRWDGRLIRYSRGFFPETKQQQQQQQQNEISRWEMIFGRADVVAARLQSEGEEVIIGDLGLDWIMGESVVDGEVEARYSRDEKKGYLKLKPNQLAGWREVTKGERTRIERRSG